MGGLKFELLSNDKNQMDKWNEALGISVRHCKEISESISKKPRTIDKLINILNNESMFKLKILCNKEIEQKVTFGIENE